MSLERDILMWDKTLLLEASVQDLQGEPKNICVCYIPCKTYIFSKNPWIVFFKNVQKEKLWWKCTILFWSILATSVGSEYVD